jgi:hypothetical protein
MIVVVIDVVLVASALVLAAVLLIYLVDHKLKFKECKGDWLIVAVLAAVLIGKLIQWCTPWL